MSIDFSETYEWAEIDADGYLVSCGQGTLGDILQRPMVDYDLVPRPSHVVIGQDWKFTNGEWAIVKKPLTLSSVKIHRNQLLWASDWTQIPDNSLSPEKREEWRVYRQAVRQAVDNYENGQELVWPDEPR